MKRPLKVGILTFHEIFNPGAFLQAYSTQTLLQRMGHDPEIIDYNPPVHRYHPVKHAWKHRWRLPFCGKMWFDAFLRDRAFARARKEHLKLSPRFKKRADIAQVHYDAVLVGADIVWNFKEKRLGQDPVYFGEGINTENLIAFAPSCGNCSIDEPVPEYVRKGLKRFSSLSTRDKNTAAIVKKGLGQRPEVICDPSFHLINELQDGVENGQTGQYILTYLLPGQTSASLVSQIQELRARNGLPVLAVYYRQNWADHNIMSASPFEWVDLIRKAKYVVTNTFHGILFAAFTQANFVFELNEAIRNKTEDVVKESGLSCRQFSDGKCLPSLFAHHLDYSSVNVHFQREAEIAKAYLAEALDRGQQER